MTEIFNMLVQTLKDNLSEEFTVTSAIVRKNNNTKHYSISIRKDEEPTTPTLYVDDILEDIGDSKISIWDGIKEILVRYNDARKLMPKFADLKILSTYLYAGKESAICIDKPGKNIWGKYLAISRRIGKNSICV